MLNLYNPALNGAPLTIHKNEDITSSDSLILQ